jgi:hypothetical protein
MDFVFLIKCDLHFVPADDDEVVEFWIRVICYMDGIVSISSSGVAEWDPYTGQLMKTSGSP